MISPFVLIHPPKENVEEIDESILLKREAGLMKFEIPHDLIANVNNIRRFAAFPIILLVLALHEETQIVQEAM
jgi:hypothetical protein